MLVFVQLLRLLLVVTLCNNVIHYQFYLLLRTDEQIAFLFCCGAHSQCSNVPPPGERGCSEAMQIFYFLGNIHIAVVFAV